MAFTEANRVQIRTYLGYAALFLQADPRLESAITAVQSVADGGTRPDNSSELAALVLITKLQAIDAQVDALMDMEGAGKVDEIAVDPARETVRLRSVGRVYVARLSRMFDTEPRADAFAPAPVLLPGFSSRPRRNAY